MGEGSMGMMGEGSVGMMGFLPSPEQEPRGTHT